MKEMKFSRKLSEEEMDILEYHNVLWLKTVKNNHELSAITL